MGTRKIEIDDDVFAFLQKHAQPLVDTENSVLRRLLLGGPTLPPRGGRSGELLPLIEAGRLLAGDQLVHHQPRKGKTHRAIVTAEGALELANGSIHLKPSPALKECVGNQINGWDGWRVERTGETLSEIRRT